jgi:hypothetical protein
MTNDNFLQNSYYLFIVTLLSISELLVAYWKRNENKEVFWEREIPRPPGGVLGMTWFFVVTGGRGEERGQCPLSSPLPPAAPKRNLSFRALARNLLRISPGRLL